MKKFFKFLCVAYIIGGFSTSSASSLQSSLSDEKSREEHEKMDRINRSVDIFLANIENLRSALDKETRYPFSFSYDQKIKEWENFINKSEKADFDRLIKTGKLNEYENFINKVGKSGLDDYIKINKFNEYDAKCLLIALKQSDAKKQLKALRAHYQDLESSFIKKLIRREARLNTINADLEQIKIVIDQETQYPLFYDYPTILKNHASIINRLYNPALNPDEARKLDLLREKWTDVNKKHNEVALRLSQTNRVTMTSVIQE